MVQNRILLALLAIVSLAFAWVLWPLFGALFWAVVFVIVFDPLSHRVTKVIGPHPHLSALIMVLGFLLLIILPSLLILSAVVSQATGLIAAVRSGQINLHAMFESTLNALPDWTQTMIQRLGLGDLTAVQDSLATSLGEWLGENAPSVLTFGQNTAAFVVSLGVMLYLMFFLFRDDEALLARLKSAIPMERGMLDDLLDTFTLVVRATVRGDILVAALQGGLGGLGFWFLGLSGVLLWTVLMSVLSLFPLFGAALVWGPVAFYLLANGAVWQGVFLIVYGIVVIGLVDNIFRPWLVGQATRMPDYIVLVSTLGGIATFGLQGFITGPVVAAMFIAVWTTFLGQTDR